MVVYEGRWTTVRVEVDEEIGWVPLNRPEKRNAIKVLVLTGAGESWTAGMDLKEYFREVDKAPEMMQERVRRDASAWQWKLLCIRSLPSRWSTDGASEADLASGGVRLGNGG